ncbi:DUF934 domain-containing protein [Litorisediminicola beolgyonensis]|uniref:DUF934 domain-containing protein n=1 Tax=Litorisediminicola beolgyonensis TaxID=1173614 RepID=A0ABW3ZP86_9RHOB
MSVIVTDAGFGPDEWTGDVIELASDTDPAELSALTAGAERVKIAFPSFSDGRGFTLARLLRLRGYRGALRASGHVIADQYAMARRAGFDAVEISDELAQRQPEDQWRFRADWQENDYQARLRG